MVVLHLHNSKSTKKTVGSTSYISPSCPTTLKLKVHLCSGTHAYTIISHARMATLRKIDCCDRNAPGGHHYYYCKWESVAIDFSFCEAVLMQSRIFLHLVCLYAKEMSSLLFLYLQCFSWNISITKFSEEN